MIGLPTQIQTTAISLPVIELAGLEVVVARLDLIDPIISGNKIFKLLYYLLDAIDQKTNHIVTMGGAYSNHLIATARACKDAGLKATGIVRGEAPAKLSVTLIQCIELGMSLNYVSREDYNNITEDNVSNFIEDNSAFTFVPEGGFGTNGAKGAAHIMQYDQLQMADTIIVSAGTATTLAGLLVGKKANQKIIVSPAIKNMIDLPHRIATLIGKQYENSFTVLDKYHFGGYAKHTQVLIDFMNTFYEDTGIPTDKVYTAKLFYGLMEEIVAGRFNSGEKIVVIHSGGLQGNKSLAAGSLRF